MYKKLAGFISAVVSHVMMAALVVMTATVVLQVLSRYVMKMPFPWVEELARYLMIWVGFLGCSIAARRGAHISITFFVNRLPERFAQLVSLLVNLCIVSFLVALIKYGVELMSFTRFQKAATLPCSMSWAYAAIPVGSALVLIEYVGQIASNIHMIASTSKGKSEPC